MGKDVPRIISGTFIHRDGCFILVLLFLVFLCVLNSCVGSQSTVCVMIRTVECVSI